MCVVFVAVDCENALYFGFAFGHVDEGVRLRWKVKQTQQHRSKHQCFVLLHILPPHNLILRLSPHPAYGILPLMLMTTDRTEEDRVGAVFIVLTLC
jgi:hypothetical protein